MNHRIQDPRSQSVNEGQPHDESLRPSADSPEPPSAEADDGMSAQVVVWLDEFRGDDGSSGRSRHHSPSSSGHTEAQAARPVRRPPTPVLTVLDDGSLETGEDIRLRDEVFTIGRRQGDLLLPHDSSVSGIHAEIHRRVVNGKYVWILKDLDTRNGTFVRSARALLTNQVILLGSRRFVLDNPLAALSVAAGDGNANDGGADSNTNEVASQPTPLRLWPTLQEYTTHQKSLVFPLKQERVVIGRLGAGTDVQIDDPLLDKRHAIIQKTPAGVWMLSSLDTLNGVWVTVPSIQLTSSCHFQCGEQRFRFVVP